MKDVAACDKLWGGGKQPLIQRFPNGVTLLDEVEKFMPEYIGYERQPGEVKHLSSRRKRNQRMSIDLSAPFLELMDL